MGVGTKFNFSTQFVDGFLYISLLWVLNFELEVKWIIDGDVLVVTTPGWLNEVLNIQAAKERRADADPAF